MLKIFSALFLVLFLSLPLFAQTDTAWVRIYSGPYGWEYPTSICLDRSGNVYVTGHSASGFYTSDYATLKYYPNGDLAWVRRYCDSADSAAGANDLAVDNAGNVYVTGYSFSAPSYHPQEYATIKYYPNGDTAWIRKYHGKDYEWNNGNALAVDDLQNVYVTGGSSGTGMYDYGTVKYCPSGDTAWVRTYDGGNYDLPYCLELDSWGNVYLTGISWAGLSGYDYATIKYYPNGDTAWVRRYSGPGFDRDKPLDLAVDDSGNAYVTGHSSSGQTKYDYLTIKYLTNGDTAWIRRFTRPVSSLDSGMAIAVDSRENVYVMGSSYGEGTGLDFILLKYSPNGTLVWQRTYNGAANSADYAKDIAIDNSDNIYLVGYSRNSSGSYDLLTVKFGADGRCYCTRKYGSAVWTPPYLTHIAVDDSQNIYVAGVSGNHYLTIKYNPIITVGDANSDGSLSISDIIYLINYLFKRGPAPEPIKKGDVNGDGETTISDIVYLINFLFKGGPSPIC